MAQMASDVIACIVQTLRPTHSATSTDRYQFAPHELVERLLRGDFGPRFMLDGATPKARKARRRLGLCFPIDLAP